MLTGFLVCLYIAPVLGLFGLFAAIAEAMGWE